MNEFLWFLPDSAYWETLIFWSFNALVAGCFAFANGNALSSISVCPTVNKRNSKVEALLIHMFSGFLVIKGVYNHIKLGKEAESKSILLNPPYEGSYLDIRILQHDLVPNYLSLWAVNMLSPEKKLPVQIAHIYCV